jgi:DNA-binding MarR family transcriptional regulator
MTLGKLRLLDHLFLLSESGESPMVKDLAARFRISSGVTSQTLNAMIQDGVVERISSPDRRTIRIRLTQEGLRLRRQTSAVYTRFMQNFLSSVETDQAESFSRILDKFLVFLENDGKRFLLP